jgi:hypothetical protein
MAERGKRTIFTDSCPAKTQEAIALEADILPGMLVEIANVGGTIGFRKSTQAATVFGAQLLVADYDFIQAGTVDDAWTEDQTMIARQVRPDDYVNVRVNTGNNITLRGTGLSSNTGGEFKIAVTDGTEQIKLIADEVINVTADGLVRARGI